MLQIQQGLTVTKSISLAFQNLVRLNIFQKMKRKAKIGMFRSAGSAVRISAAQHGGGARGRTGSQERRRGEVPEHGEAVDEDEERQPADAPPRQVRLQAVGVRELRAVKALLRVALVCVRGQRVNSTRGAAAIKTHRSGRR